jgi:hypothetical protein
MIARMMFLMSILGTLMLLPSTSAAQASCWGYLDEQGQCVGCNEPYFYSLCTSGCVHGYCNSRGGGGQCSCGYRYYSASISHDGGSCAGDECGLVRVRVSRLAHDSKERNVAFQGGGSVEQLPTNVRSGLPSRVPRLLFVLNRCNHSFELIQRDIGLLAGGM